MLYVHLVRRPGEVRILYKVLDKIIRGNFDQYMGMWNKEGEEDDEGQTT